MSAESPNRIVFTDPGIDDFAAIKYLAARQMFSPEYNVLVSTFGNVPEKQTFKNLLQIHSVLNLNPECWSISRGPKIPLRAAYAPIANKAYYGGNGPNGLWNVSTPEDAQKKAQEPNILSLGKADLNHISELISFGPLTGPVVLQKDSPRPEKILIMGGAFKMGNVRRLDEKGDYLASDPSWVAEFNMFKDAKAARRQFEKYSGDHVFLVTMDACMGALVSAKSIMEGSYADTADGRFTKKLLQSWAVEFGRVHPEFVAWGQMLADLIAIIGFNNPDLLVWEKTGIEVVDDIGPDLGRTVKSKANPKCNVAVSVNDTEVKTLMEAINSTIFGH